MPIAMHERMLLAQHLDGRRVLGLIQFVRVLDAEFRPLRHEIQRGVGDVDWAVVGLDAPLVRLAVG